MKCCSLSLHPGTEGYAKRIALLTAIALFIGFTMQADGQVLVTPLIFFRIAQTGETPPGGTGPFTGFQAFCNGTPLQKLAPSVDADGQVVFVGEDTAPPPCVSGSGVFLGSGPGPLSTVIDRSVNPPGIVSTFADFEEPVVGPYGVAFWGRDSSFLNGIFARFVGVGVVLKTVAATYSQVPGTTSTFNGVDDPRIFNNLIAFDGRFPAGVGNQEGIFIGDTSTFGGSLLPPLFAVAMTGDDPPGVVGPFSSLPGGQGLTSPVVIGDQGSAAFIGNDANFNYGIFQGTYDIIAPPNRIITTLISSGDS